MRPATRPQYHRLQRILELIREGTRTGSLPNGGHFIRELEVSRRSVMRDLDFLRDDHHAPIAYGDSRKGFQLTDPTFSLPPVQLTRREVSGKASGAQLNLERAAEGAKAAKVKTSHEASDCFQFYILPSSFFIHRTAPRPPPHYPHTAWLAAKRPAQVGECRMQNAECRMQNEERRGEATTQGMQNEECRMQKRPGKATLMRHQCDIKATSMRVASQAVATFMRPQSHPHATSKPPSCDPKAPTRLPQSLGKGWRAGMDLLAWSLWPLGGWE